jgi:hypothetical protein
METLQMVIGSSCPLFHYPIQQILKFCHRNWLLNVWWFLFSMQGKIHLENAWSLVPQHIHDAFLMDAVLEHIPRFPRKILKCFNACQIFLQVFTLADICDGSRLDILKCSLHGIRHKDRHSSYEWPKQTQPSSAAWCIWRNTLQTLFCATTRGTRLCQPLGPWIHGAPSHQHWTYFFHPGTKSLIYSVEASGMFHCFCQARQSPRIFHSTSDIIFSRPSQMIPVTVAQVTAHFLELSACPIPSHMHGHTNHTRNSGIHRVPTISQHLQQLPPILHNTIGHCHFPLDTSNLVEGFNSETLVLASDGSVLMDAATQAWILYGTCTDTRAYGHGPVPGGGQPLTSLHAEVGGYVGGMLALDAILSTANNVSHAPD